MQTMPRLFQTLPALAVGETPTAQRFIPQSDGRDGVRETLDLMTRAKNDYKTHPTVRGLMLRLIKNLPQKDYAGEIETARDFVKYRIRYARDVAGVETVQTPLKTLEFGAGDCDDKSTLLAALLESVGHKTRFKAVAVNGGELCHVYPEVMLAGKWRALETTEPVAGGWEPPNITDEMYSLGEIGEGYEFGWSPDEKKQAAGRTANKLREAENTAIEQSRVKMQGKFGKYAPWYDSFIAALGINEHAVMMPASDEMLYIMSRDRNIDVQRMASAISWAKAAVSYNSALYVMDAGKNQYSLGTDFSGMKFVTGDGGEKLNADAVKARRDFAAKKALDTLHGVTSRRAYAITAPILAAALLIAALLLRRKHAP